MRGTEDKDLLYGLRAIGDHLGLRTRQVQHQISAGNLPSFKMGDKVCASKAALAEHFAQKLRSAGGGK